MTDKFRNMHAKCVFRVYFHTWKIRDWVLFVCPWTNLIPPLAIQVPPPPGFLCICCNDHFTRRNLNLAKTLVYPFPITCWKVIYFPGGKVINWMGNYGQWADLLDWVGKVIPWVGKCLLVIRQAGVGYGLYLVEELIVIVIAIHGEARDRSGVWGSETRYNPYPTTQRTL